MQEKKLINKAPQTLPASAQRGRRRFLQGSIATGPLVMTLVSRPVLGQQACQTPSQAGSMPTSHAHGQLPVCEAASPEFWSQPQNFAQWPSPYSPTSHGGPKGPITTASAGQASGLTTQSGLATEATLFSSAFQPSPYPAATTFLTVLQNAASDGVAAHLVAAKLNVAKGWLTVLDDARIQTMWLEYTSQGYYEPTAGVKWFAPDIVAYLQSLETK